MYGSPYVFVFIYHTRAGYLHLETTHFSLLPNPSPSFLAKSAADWQAEIRTKLQTRKS